MRSHNTNRLVVIDGPAFALVSWHQSGQMRQFR